MYAGICREQAITMLFTSSLNINIPFTLWKIFTISSKKHNAKAAPQTSVPRRFSAVSTETGSRSQSRASIALLDPGQMIYFELVENSLNSKYILRRNTGRWNVNDWGETFCLEARALEESENPWDATLSIREKSSIIPNTCFRNCSEQLQKYHA